MRHVRTLGLCLVAVFALSALTAGGAWAAEKPGLVLLDEATPAEAGTTAYGVFVAHECTLLTTGTLTNNKSKTDKAAFAGESFSECTEAGYAISGQVSSAELKTSGTMSFKAAVTLSVPGPCNYLFKKYSVTFNTHEAFATHGKGSATGKLGKSGSSPSCAKTLSVPFSAYLDTATLGTFGTEIS